MSNQPPTQPPGYGIRSPDGKWWWDGQQWQPVPEEPARSPSEEGKPAPSPVPPRRIPRWPLIPGVVIGLLIIFGVCVAIANNSSKQSAQPVATTTTRATATATATPTPQPATPDPRGTCSPQPCANDDYGWIVVISDVKYDVPSGNQFIKPEAGNVFVTMNVTFTNKLNRERHANPTQFVLLDGAGIKHTFTIGPCEVWSAVNVTPGATFGPKCLSFQAAAGKPEGLVLVWTPSFGDYRIKLT